MERKGFEMIKLFEILFPRYVWRIKTKEKQLFLTFDDGPIPGITEWVLEQLRQYDAKATFFVVGANVQKNREIYLKIFGEGHAIGNHTHNHLNGWKTQNEDYLNNFEKCQKEISFLPESSSMLFRPPYGRIKKKQANEILKTHKVIMWSVLTRDYDNSLDTESCLKYALAKTQSGAIVLFHDSLKAQRNLKYVLPRYLEHFSKRGYEFKALEF